MDYINGPFNGHPIPLSSISIILNGAKFRVNSFLYTHGVGIGIFSLWKMIFKLVMVIGIRCTGVVRRYSSTKISILANFYPAFEGWVR